jgi:hypothetical protein
MGTWVHEYRGTGIVQGYNWYRNTTVLQACRSSTGVQGYSSSTGYRRYTAVQTFRSCTGEQE